MNQYCHPSYTAQECARYCQQNPGACTAQVPEPGMFVLLAVAMIAAWLVSRMRRE
jgi:hypothetical protein